MQLIEFESKSCPLQSPPSRDLHAQSCFFTFLSLSSLLIMLDGDDKRNDMRGALDLLKERREEEH